ncbi:hypothetical protein OBBRIDRAFT_392996 [Obba rivulosa]|uniref:Uncharacterized protein n=1 Tax=Obba rivulosa TaxID=1052685 RepID=A0A8E2B1B1_9APHY|nr:hypothetical protein OBBRIDRAFT_392996 [Obba rivulosa]
MSSPSYLTPPSHMSSPQSSNAPQRPPLPHRHSRNRLHLPAHPNEPPIPPRLIGSPLLQKLTTEPHYISPKAASEVWLDRDEFGIQRSHSQGRNSSSLSASGSTPLMPSPSSSQQQRHPPSGSPQTSSRHYAPPLPSMPTSSLPCPGTKRAGHPPSQKAVRIPELGITSPLALSAPDCSR